MSKPKTVRKDRDREDLFEAYYLDKDSLGELSLRESIFVSYLDGMTYYRKFKYVSKVEDNIFLGTMENQNVLIKLVLKGSLRKEDRDEISSELYNLSNSSKLNGVKVIKTYCIYTKPAGESEIVLLSRLNLN